ncbi:hypothetical protein CKAN_00390000 [Cinnamomum micranthum f. kanehirae]|uniref:Uncharacterized protein n=1 Tax=Cinnamomum micranthum f. kanehirae TaxID=337451 RepID=A0A3S3MKU6_9MAGN|nr:hypothetical protein CKAN_00390000 [Cinnamomum micranthum f. kanehirae]
MLLFSIMIYRARVKRELTKLRSQVVDQIHIGQFIKEIVILGQINQSYERGEALRLLLSGRSPAVSL